MTTYNSYSGIRLEPKGFSFLDYVLDKYYWNNNVTVPPYSGGYFDPCTTPRPIFKDPNGREWYYLSSDIGFSVKMGQLRSIAYMWINDYEATQEDFDETPKIECLLLWWGQNLPGPKTIQSIREGKAIIVSVVSGSGIGGGDSWDSSSCSSITIDWKALITSPSARLDDKLMHFNNIGPTYHDSSSSYLKPDKATASYYDIPIWSKEKSGVSKINVWDENATIARCLAQKDPDYLLGNPKTFIPYIVDSPKSANVYLMNPIPMVPSTICSGEHSISTAELENFADWLTQLAYSITSRFNFEQRFLALNFMELLVYLKTIGYPNPLINWVDLNLSKSFGDICGQGFVSKAFPNADKPVISIPVGGGLEFLYDFSGVLRSYRGNNLSLSNLDVGIPSGATIASARGVVFKGIEHLNERCGIPMNKPQGLQEFIYGESSGSFCMCGLNFSLSFDLEPKAKALGYVAEKDITKIITQGSERTGKLGNIVY